MLASRAPLRARWKIGATGHETSDSTPYVETSGGYSHSHAHVRFVVVAVEPMGSAAPDGETVKR
jgi:hypothetical protein